MKVPINILLIRNDADVLGIRNGCTFTGWTGSGYDGEKFTVTAGPGPRDRLNKFGSYQAVLLTGTFLGGLSSQDLRATTSLTRTFSHCIVFAGDRTRRQTVKLSFLQT